MFEARPDDASGVLVLEAGTGVGGPSIGIVAIACNRVGYRRDVKLEG